MPPHSLPPPCPPQPDDVPWPVPTWPTGAPASDVDAERLLRATTDAFTTLDEVGETRALLVVHRGRLVVERYATDLTVETTLPSWSMAKSLLHAVVGTLVADGRLDIHAPAPVAAWRTHDDPRAGITLDHLLRMSDGLAFREEYVDGAASDVIPMLFGEGKSDVAAYAEAFPLAHEPGTYWNYSSGTSNIISGIVRRTLGGEEAYRAYLAERIFEPLGLTSAAPRFDAAGSWIASSFVFATARDFARLGLLYLRGGAWQGRPMLPQAWIDYARTPAPACPTREYGAHWWIYPERPDVFFASGYEGQRVIVAPMHDVVIVRSGRSRIEQRDAINALGLRLIDPFPRVYSTS